MKVVSNTTTHLKKKNTAEKSSITYQNHIPCRNHSYICSSKLKSDSTTKTNNSKVYFLMLITLLLEWQMYSGMGYLSIFWQTHHLLWQHTVHILELGRHNLFVPAKYVFHKQIWKFKWSDFILTTTYVTIKYLHFKCVDLFFSCKASVAFWMNDRFFFELKFMFSAVAQRKNSTNFLNKSPLVNFTQKVML